MTGITTAPPVRAINHRRIATNKRPGAPLPPSEKPNKPPRPTGSVVTVDKDKGSGGALANFCQNMHDVSAALMRPKSSAPNSPNAPSKKTSKGAASQMRENMAVKHSGASEEFRRSLSEYANTITESSGPPVKIAEPIKTFNDEVTEAAAKAKAKAATQSSGPPVKIAKPIETFNDKIAKESARKAARKNTKRPESPQEKFVKASTRQSKEIVSKPKSAPAKQPESPQEKFVKASTRQSKEIVTKPKSAPAKQPESPQEKFLKASALKRRRIATKPKSAPVKQTESPQEKFVKSLSSSQQRTKTQASLQQAWVRRRALAVYSSLVPTHTATSTPDNNEITPNE
ncbi:MAG: hypothetical protein GY794_12245 [bacterium]|nr:hypothetical protein [bacterium]